MMRYQSVMLYRKEIDLHQIQLLKDDPSKLGLKHSIWFRMCAQRHFSIFISEAYGYIYIYI